MPSGFQLAFIALQSIRFLCNRCLEDLARVCMILILSFSVLNSSLGDAPIRILFNPELPLAPRCQPFCFLLFYPVVSSTLIWHYLLPPVAIGISIVSFAYHDSYCQRKLLPLEAGHLLVHRASIDTSSELCSRPTSFAACRCPRVFYLSPELLILLWLLYRWPTHRTTEPGYGSLLFARFFFACFFWMLVLATRGSTMQDTKSISFCRSVGPFSFKVPVHMCQYRFDFLIFGSRFLDGSACWILSWLSRLCSNAGLLLVTCHRLLRFLLSKYLVASPHASPTCSLLTDNIYPMTGSLWLTCQSCLFISYLLSTLVKYLLTSHDLLSAWYLERWANAIHPIFFRLHQRYSICSQLGVPTDCHYFLPNLHYFGREGPLGTETHPPASLSSEKRDGSLLKSCALPRILQWLI